MNLLNFLPDISTPTSVEHMAGNSWNEEIIFLGVETIFSHSMPTNTMEGYDQWNVQLNCVVFTLPSRCFFAEFPVVFLRWEEKTMSS